MYIYFPGYGIQMSTIDPTFLIKEFPLSSKAWFDVKLQMTIKEKLNRNRVYPVPGYSDSQNMWTRLGNIEKDPIPT